MEQLSMLEEKKEEKIIKQMKLSIKKGIVPGAKVIFDGDVEPLWSVVDLYCSCEHNLRASLFCDKTKTHMSWDVLSDRLSAL